MELQNLKELAEKLRNDFASNFDSSDRELPNTFKEKVKKINTFNLKYNKYSVIFKGEKGALDSYIPNINIYIAAYYNQYTKELFKYKKEVEKVINQNEIEGDLKTFFTNERDRNKPEDSLFLKMLETQDISTNNKELLYKFVTDYEWWGGGKTIDRPDFFHSAILSVIGVTAAANVTLAYICGHLAENGELADVLNNNIKTSSMNRNRQIIFYGSPGTGKSYGIKKLLLDDNIDEESMVGVDRIYRTTFHPDSDYSSFVGCYKPISKRKNIKLLDTAQLKLEYDCRYKGKFGNTTKDIAALIKDYAESIVVESYRSTINQVIVDITGTGNSTYFVEMVNLVVDERKTHNSFISYEFIPQVFTDAYVAAWERNEKGENVFLVIEEINRGNCAQIFGDLFQLLDRNLNGNSEYKVKADTALKEYLEKRLGDGHPGIKNGELNLPFNLHILATMNTSDQSLFPMDSAFKRRWSWEYIPINEKCTDSQFKITIGNLTYPWSQFISTVNKRILKLTESEDKQLGNFFIKNDVDVKEFKSKVMFYLWSEVCKEYYNAGSFFKYKNKFNGEDKEIEFTFSQLFNDNDTYILQGFMSYLDVKNLEDANE